MDCLEVHWSNRNRSQSFCFELPVSIPVPQYVNAHWTLYFRAVGSWLVLDSYMHDQTCICDSSKQQLPYSLDQTPRLLFISSRNFVQLLLESGYYSRVAFIKLGMEDGEIHCLKEGGVAARQGVNPNRHCHACHCNRYRARGIRPLRRCWRGLRWVGEEWTSFRRLLIHYAMLSTILKL